MNREINTALNKNDNYTSYVENVSSNLSNTIKLESNMLNAELNLKKLTEQAENNFEEATKGFNETANKMDELIQEANRQHKYNTDVLIPEIKEFYTEKLKTYVDSLARSLDVINKQLYISYVTPNLVSFINPFRKVYNSIYDSFMKPENQEFIKKYYPNFDIEKEVKPFKAPEGGVQDLTANFEASEKIQSVQSNMKQI